MINSRKRALLRRLFRQAVFACGHGRRLGSRYGGDGFGALAPKIFFCRPPKLRNLGGGTAGDSL